MKAHAIKILGAPLQRFYQKGLKQEGSSVQSKIIRHLQGSLRQKGQSYHVRTLKRQLNGAIQYIPELLEQLTLDYFKKNFPFTYKKGFSEFKKDKNLLEHSHKPSLYVPQDYFKKMVRAYLYRHKELSTRQLALKIHQTLKEKKVPLSLETILAALNGKTQKIKKVLEDELEIFFKQDGFKNREEVEKYISEQKKSDAFYQWNEIVPVEQITQSVSDLIAKYPHLTRRQLALKLQADLLQENFHYSLSSLQWILGGKTQKAKGIVKKYLDGYLSEESFFQEVEQQNLKHKKKTGRPSLYQRLVESYEQLQQAEEQNRESLRNHFLNLRVEFIKKRWLLKHPVYSPLIQTSSGDAGESLEAESWKEKDQGFNLEHHFLDRLVS